MKVFLKLPKRGQIYSCLFFWKRMRYLNIHLSFFFQWRHSFSKSYRMRNIVLEYSCRTNVSHEKTFFSTCVHSVLPEFDKIGSNWLCCRLRCLEDFIFTCSFSTKFTITVLAFSSYMYVLRQFMCRREHQSRAFWMAQVDFLKDATNEWYHFAGPRLALYDDVSTFSVEKQNITDLETDAINQELITPKKKPWKPTIDHWIITLDTWCKTFPSLQLRSVFFERSKEGIRFSCTELVYYRRKKKKTPSFATRQSAL